MTLTLKKAPALVVQAACTLSLNKGRPCSCFLCTTGTYFTAQPLEQRAASWYIPFVMMPGSEEALMANDWALFKLLMGQNAKQDQVDEVIERLSQPGAHCVRRSQTA